MSEQEEIVPYSKATDTPEDDELEDASEERGVKRMKEAVASIPDPYREILQEIGEDFQFNLKLLEERDEELGKSDTEIRKLKALFSQRGAEVKALKDQVESLTSKVSLLKEENDDITKRNESSGTAGATSYLSEGQKLAKGQLDPGFEYDKDFDESVQSVLNQSTPSTENYDQGQGNMNISQQQFHTLLRKYEALHADYVSAKYQLAESNRKNEEMEELNRYSGSSGQRSDLETQLTFLKHELECEQHLKLEALRSLEVESRRNKEVKKTLLKDYEAKCLSLMRHLKSVEDSFAEQQKENDRLREESLQKKYLESRLIKLASTANQDHQAQISQILAKDAALVEKEEPRLTTLNLKRHLKQETKRVDMNLSDEVEEALTSIASTVTDHSHRLKKLEMERKEKDRMLARSNHRLKAAVPLVNLAYAYCSAAQKAAPEELKGKYSHITEVKSVAKAILRYVKKKDEEFIPYTQLDLNTEPLQTEARRLRNQSGLALAVFSIDETVREPEG